MKCLCDILNVLSQEFIGNEFSKYHCCTLDMYIVKCKCNKCGRIKKYKEYRYYYKDKKEFKIVDSKLIAEGE